MKYVCDYPVSFIFFSRVSGDVSVVTFDESTRAFFVCVFVYRRKKKQQKELASKRMTKPAYREKDTWMNSNCNIIYDKLVINISASGSF